MAINIPLTADHMRKYDIQTPCYTCYPSTLKFNSGFGEVQLKEHAARSNSSLLPKSLSIYVHNPFCHPLCTFCDSNGVTARTGQKQLSAYLDRLHTEIRMRSELCSHDRLVTQIHFGGGTAKFFNVDQLGSILDQIATRFHLDLPRNLDISIDLDPCTTSPEEVTALAECGFNGFNLSVQNFPTNVHLTMNQQYCEVETLAIVNAAVQSSKSVKLDLVIGLYNQNIDDFSITLAKVIATKVPQIVVYNLAVLPYNIKAQQNIDPTNLPASRNQTALTLLVRSSLLHAGYVHLGMDHYALPDDPLATAQLSGSLERNFQGYTAHRDTDLIGLGACALSKFDTAFAQNESSLSLYNELIDMHSLPISKGLVLSEDDRIRADVIQQILCVYQVDLRTSIGNSIERDCKMTIGDYFSRELDFLNDFIEDGLIVMTPQGFRVTETGRYFMRPIAKVFDRYLSPSNGERVVPFPRAF